MSDNNFSLNGSNFKVGKLSAMKQYHLVRRMGPILSDLIPALKSIGPLKPDEALSEVEKLEKFAPIASAVLSGLSKLSDEDADKVLYGLLSAIEIQVQPIGNWAKVATESVLMFQNLELPTLLQLAGRAFAFNLSGFFQGLPSKE